MRTCQDWWGGALPFGFGLRARVAALRNARRWPGVAQAVLVVMAGALLLGASGRPAAQGIAPAGRSYDVTRCRVSAEALRALPGLAARLAAVGNALAGEGVTSFQLVPSEVPGLLNALGAVAEEARAPTSHVHVTPNGIDRMELDNGLSLTGPVLEIGGRPLDGSPSVTTRLRLAGEDLGQLESAHAFSSGTTASASAPAGAPRVLLLPLESGEDIDVLVLVPTD